MAVALAATMLVTTNGVTTFADAIEESTAEEQVVETYEEPAEEVSAAEPAEEAVEEAAPAEETVEEETSEEVAEEESEPEEEVSEDTEAEEEASEEEEAEDLAATSISMRIVDEDGDVIDAAYEDLELPEFDSELSLSASPYDGTVIRVENVSGTSRYYTQDYAYDYAELNGTEISVIRSEETEDGETAYAYSTDGETFTDLTEDATLVLHYTCEQEKVTYIYEDSSVKVTAALDSADAIPDDAEFVVTPITESSSDYNYDAYMEALNAAAEEEDLYTSDNTLLYDIAFLEAKTDADGNAVSGQVEVEPVSGSVKITAQFKNAQLSEDISAEDAESVAIHHLSLKDSVNADVDSTKEATDISASDIQVEELSADVSVENAETAEFTMDSFSVTAVSAVDTNLNYYSASEINYQTVLGDAIEYGIVADTYDQTASHTETNFAVKTYKNNSSVLEIDLSNDADIPFIVGVIDTNLRFGNLTDSNNIDIYTQASETGKVSADNSAININFIEQTKTQIDATVDAMISSMSTTSGTLAGLTPTTIADASDEAAKGVKVSGNTIDTTSLPDGATIVIDAATIFSDQNAWNNAPTIVKRAGQNIVINVGAGYSSDMIRNFQVQVGDKIVKSNDQTVAGNDSDQNKEIDEYILRHIIWNVTTSKVTTIQDSAGVFLFANNSNVTVRNSAGWMISNGQVTAGGEWHFIFHGRTYKAEGKTLLTAKKTLEGSTLSDGQFSFILQELDSDGKLLENGVSQTKTNDASGNIEFDEIDYTTSDLDKTDGTGKGTKYYLLQEVIPEGAVLNKDGKYELNGIIYDDTAYLVEIALEDNGSGTITTTNTYYQAVYDSENQSYAKGDAVSESGLSFANATKAAAAEAELKVTKNFNNWGKASSFTFNLEAVTKDAPMPEGTVNGIKTATATESSTTASFGTITYEEAGTYEYKITEVIPDTKIPGVVYDTTVHTVKVSVTKADDGTLSAEVQYDNKDSSTPVFTNTFKAAEATLQATKSFNDWGKADSFTFNLTAKDNAPMPAGAEEGTISAKATQDNLNAIFGTITYKEEGTYTYTIREVNDKIDGVTYDTATHEVVVTVKANEQTNVLEADVKYDGASTLIITNTYDSANATLQVTKDFNDWGKASSFTFNLAAVTEGAPMPEDTKDGIKTATASESSTTASFGTITYEEAGTYEYTIKEVNDGADGVAYDTTAHKVVVVVSKNADTNKLSTKVTYDGNDSLTITNTYAAASTSLEVTKDFADWGKADSFTFNLKATTENAPMPSDTVDGIKSATATKDSKTASFGTISYEKAGVYKYTITEVNGGADGVTYDTTAHNVVVTVTKDTETNALSAAVTYDNESSLTIKNTYAATSAELEVTKDFADWGKADSFTFDLAAVTEGAPMPASVKATATKEDPTASFGTITYEKAGIYEYTIAEENGGADGVTYDKTAHKVVVTVTKDETTNALSAVVTYDGEKSLTITNTYAAASTSLEVTKDFADWGKADSFTFDLAADTEGAPMPASVKATATAENQTASFGTITYEKAGIYEYTITEENGGADGVTYDKTAHKVVVTVTKKDDNTNALSAVVTYDGEDSLTITNTYAAAEATLQATKQFNDWSKADSFTFNLTAVDDAPMPKGTEDGVKTATATKDSVDAVFGTITYEKAGIYEYEIQEEAGSVKGITYDTAKHKVVVTVSKDAETNELEADVKYDGGSKLIITNTYASASATLQVTKNFADWGKADNFTFVLAAKDNAPMPEGATDGKITATATENAQTAVFGSITYETAGTYKYTITEVNDGIDGVTYDTQAHEVVVKVEKDDDGNLVAVVTYDNEQNLTITNTYTAANAELKVTKDFEDWGKADSFTFDLKAVTEGAPMPEGATDGKITATATEGSTTASFGTITYEKAGTYEYTIIEENGGADGVTYDTTAHKVVVTVTKDKTTNALSTTVTYDGEKSLTITNTYAATNASLEVTKDFADWGKADSFTFDLAAVTKDAPMPTSTTAKATSANKVASFGTITYEKAGTYEYTITEENGGVDGVTYDTTAHKVVVTVTKDETTNALSAVVTYDGEDSLTITNTYAATNASLKVTKDFADWGKADSFTFNLAAVTKDAPMPKQTTATATEKNPTAAFGTITYEKAGTYEYTITEVNDHVDGVTYDATAHKVTVVVSKGTDNALSTQVTYDGAASLTITNTYAAAKATLQATKQFNDWSKAESFTFNLTAKDNAPMPEGTVNGVKTATAKEDNVDAVFGEITYEKAGTYEYTITEVDDGVDGVSYDTTAHKVVVTVTADKDTNVLTATVKYDDADKLIITNTYASAKATLQATKQFNDWGKADSFTFVLAAKDNAPMPSGATNGQISASATASKNTAVFGEITYEKAGTYEYTITEVNDGADGVTYDTTAHKVVVQVTKGKNNQLSTAVTYDGEESLTITNTYTAAKTTLEATKDFADWGKADSFTFTLTALNGAPMPTEAENNAVNAFATEENPTASFGEITYEKAGTYEYEITEVKGEADGVTYDTTAHKVVVTVTKADETNALSAVVTYDGEKSLTITNAYAATSAEIQVNKTFNAWTEAAYAATSAANAEFAFTLAAVTEGAPMPEKTTATATKDAPTVSFGEITYEKTGTYVYTVTETDGGVDGVTYDTTAHQVTVTVTKDADNKMSAEVSYDQGTDALEVTNTFAYAATEATLQAAKQINYWGDAESFTFTLQAKDNAPMPEGAEDGVKTASATKGNVDAVFGTITYDTPGTYAYIITEVDDGVDGITYDSTEHTAVVTVTAEDAELSAEVVYDETENALVITNTNAHASAAVTLQATKSFKAWGKADYFTFTLTAKDDAPMPEGAEDGKLSKNATKSASTAVFGTIVYEEEGTYEYTITEVNSGIKGVTYDTKKHKVVVTVTKDEDGKLNAAVTYDGEKSLVITNTYSEKAKGGKTGDSTKPILWAALLVTAGVAMEEVFRRRRNRAR